LQAEKPAAERSVIILLGDGVNNEGMSNQEALAGPAAEVARRGVCIHSAGFGGDSEFDPLFLQ
jgi:hypothetical protein